MFEESGSLSPIDAVGKKISAISDGSRVITTVRTLGSRTSDFVQESYCYRWLTKEPDPEVIVIDLRETYTVGPFIALLDRIIPHVKHAWEHSHVGLVAEGVFERLSEGVFDPLAETRGYKFAVSVLAPPEPPERERTTGDDPGSNEDEPF
ncbi:hypothetical protein G9463_03830 [Haloarcula sp. JP-Z28]|uniref:hypothetical protein n=1 Tax=Haloarcula sp. JP-Z28 TaxID=2716715 RepID=UPI0014053AF0|nr:hypothetical protein [Haloarcula sp. JP-Z28]NHN62441.1 hypothetical protein [Haloarcula sp. JP-Z28]